ncbi:RDD family protein [Streptomyces sp. NPDC020719]|uniref:RDD family protein n=1 Tax=Streptomyces sp. NPDC020719 TaxID=3154896 RepID=UPI0033DC5FE9
MSAPTPATGDGTPVAGFYPDPSIPGYVRYWNGAAWVPGTSRPAPADGEAVPVPPPGAAPAAPALASAPPTPMPAPAPLPLPAVEETGPVFLDEPEPEPVPPHGMRPGPAPVWQADVAHQSGFGDDAARRVSWGQPDPRGALGQAQPGPAPSPSRTPVSGPQSLPVQSQPVQPLPLQPLPAQPLPAQQPAPMQPVDPRTAGDPRRAEPDVRPAAVDPAPSRAALPSPPVTPAHHAPPQHTAPPQQPAPAQHAAPQPAASPMTTGPGGGAASWAQQVHQLARPDERQGAGEPVVPWKPPVEDPFLRAARAQAEARPAGPGRRLAARLVDTAVLGVAVAGLAVPLGVQAADHIQEKIDTAKLSGETVTVYFLDGTTAGYLGIILGAFLVLGLLYEALPTAKWGRTLGKRLLRLQVRDIESHEPPSFGAALRRWLVYGVLGVLAVGVVNVLWCLFDRPWRQCWHDKAARTFVAGT